MTLTSLDLYRNNLGEAFGKEIAEMLKANARLTSLNLVYNALGEASAKEIIKELKTNRSITILNMEGNSFDSNEKTSLDSITKLCERNKDYQRNFPPLLVGLAAYRANRNSKIKNSFLPLMSMIQQFADRNSEPEDIPLLNPSKTKKGNDRKAFLDTQYAQAIINSAGAEVSSAEASTSMAASAINIATKSSF